MKVRNVAIAGAISLAAAAALSSPAYAATQHHNPDPSPGHHRHDDRCWLSVSDPRPHDFSDETLTVSTDDPWTTVAVQINYKTVSHTWFLQTGGSGQAYRNFNIGHATPHYTVTLDGVVVDAPHGDRTGATCYTEFTPRH
jgi:hypothetical protein